MKSLQRIGWLLSYFQLVVLIPFGTCTQGDDGPWSASLFYAVVPLLGLLLISVSTIKIQKSLMGIPHILTLSLILWNTPYYWIRVAFQGQHICAGFEEDLINSFKPELWHRAWAPIVTVLGLAFVFMGFTCFRNFIKEHRTNRLT